MSVQIHSKSLQIEPVGINISQNALRTICCYDYCITCYLKLLTVTFCLHCTMEILFPSLPNCM